MRYSTLTPHAYLSYRIALKLHDQKIAMEAQIRAELEAEYHNDRHVTKKFAGDNNDGEYNEIYVRKLHNELSQVKREQEQWRCERKEIQVTISSSKAEFERVWKKLKSECLHPSK